MTFTTPTRPKQQFQPWCQTVGKSCPFSSNQRYLILPKLAQIFIEKLLNRRNLINSVSRI